MMKSLHTSLLIAGALAVGAAVFAASALPAPSTAVFVEDAGGEPAPEPTHKELMAEYAPHGVTEKGGALFFDGEPIRYFLDGYETGESVLSRYCYYAAEGTVDVHTVREDKQNPDGSTALFGPITDIAAYSQAEFDARRFPEPTLDQTAVTFESASDSVGGTSMEERFAPYAAFGLTYAPDADSALGSLTYNGQPVRAFLDQQPDGGVFSHSAPTGAVDVSTVYGADGSLTGLRAIPAT